MKLLVFLIVFLVLFDAAVCESKSISLKEKNLDDEVCSLCNTLVPVLRDLIKIGQVDLAVNLTIDACIRLKYEDDLVCHQLIGIDKVIF